MTDVPVLKWGVPGILPLKFKALKAPTLVNVFKRVRIGEPIKVVAERFDPNSNSNSIIELNLFVDKVEVLSNCFVISGLASISQSQIRFSLTYTKNLPSQRITGQMVEV